MNKDCIKIDDMQFTEMHTNPLHGTVKARLRGSSEASKMSITLPLSPTVREVLEFHKDNELEVYIVRKGSNMANLGMAIIKASFDQGFTGADKYESMATEVREMIGTRILTKVVEPEFIHHTETDRVAMRIDGVEVCDCKDLQAYTRPDGVVLFERADVGGGSVHSTIDGNTELFKSGFIANRCYLAMYVRPASEVQHIEYLKLKYKYLKKLENETDSNK